MFDKETRPNVLKNAPVAFGQNNDAKFTDNCELESMKIVSPFVSIAMWLRKDVLLI